MALSQRLEFRQTQALVMTPQLMQAIKLLQLSSLDLAAYVEAELEKNPLLERANDDYEAPAAGAEPERAASEGEEDAAVTSDWIGQDMETSRASMEEGLGTELENVFPDDGGEKSAAPEMPPPAYSEWSGAGTRGGEDSAYNLEAFVTAEITLAAYLAEQMALAISDPAGRMIGQYLIDMVDEAGYLTGDLDTVADKLGAPRSDVEAVLAILQTLDPPGVCARNLTECLAIQLKERDRFDPAMRTLVEHLDLLAKRDLAALRRLCGVNDEDLADMIAEIRNLNPKPGLAFGSTTGAADRARCLCAGGAGRHLAGRTQFRHAAESPHQPALLRASVEDHAQRQGQDLSRRLPADRDLAGARARPAREDHSQSVERDRAPAGRPSSPRACSICGRSISRPSPTPSACTSRPSRASPPTNTWRPAAAYSS